MLPWYSVAVLVPWLLFAPAQRVLATAALADARTQPPAAVTED